MSKIILSDLADLQNETTAVNKINSNNSVLETAFENTLSRDGTSPNQMLSNLDMNSKRILNLPAAGSPTEPVRKQEINELEEKINDLVIDGIISGTVSVPNYVTATSVGADNTGILDTKSILQTAFATGQSVFFSKGNYKLTTDVTSGNATQTAILDAANLTGPGDILGVIVQQPTAKGFWYPVINVAGSAVGMTQTGEGRYTSDGIFCRIELEVLLTNKGSNAGQITIRELPLTLSPSNRWPVHVDITGISGVYNPNEIHARLEGGVISFWRGRSTTNPKPLLASDLSNLSSFTLCAMYSRV